MTRTLFLKNASGQPVQWDGKPVTYGGQALSAAWVAAQTWAVPFAAKLVGQVAVVCLTDGSLLLDKNLGQFRRAMFFPFDPVSDWKVDTCHADTNYPARWAKYHPGLDINKKTGGDTDFNLPFKARADGIVVFVSESAGADWGGMIVTWHPQFGTFTRDAHHKAGTCKVKVGDYVTGGKTVLAHVGKGHLGAFSAHLHQDEVILMPGLSRSGRVHWAYWPGDDLAGFKRHFGDPAKSYALHRCVIPPVPNRCRPEAR